MKTEVTLAEVNASVTPIPGSNFAVTISWDCPDILCEGSMVFTGESRMSRIPQRYHICSKCGRGLILHGGASFPMIHQFPPL